MFVAPVVACEISWPPTTPRGVARSWPSAWTTFMERSLAPGLPQPRQTFGDLRRGMGGEREAQGGAVGLAREEREAGHERDIARQRAREQRLGVPAVREPRPDEHAALGTVVRRPGRQSGGQPVEQRVAAASVLGAQDAEMRVEIDRGE